MALVSHIIAGFYNGMSQQPAAIRLDTQCDYELNGWSSLVDGMLKRPPSEHVAVLSSNASSASFVHTINRNVDERYTCIFTGDATEPIEVFTESGTKCTVRYGTLTDDLTYTADATVKNYVTSLSSKNPVDVLRAYTVADHTFIANSTIKCAMSGTPEGTMVENAIINIKKGVYKTDYMVYIDGALVASYTSGESTDYNTYKTNVIASSLGNTLAGLLVASYTGDGYTSEFKALSSSGISVKKNGTTITAGFTISGDTVTFPTTLVADDNGSHYESSVAVGDSIVITSTVATKFYVKQTGSALLIWTKDGSSFSVKTGDSWGDQAMQAAKGSVQKFTDLPAQGFNGFVVQIAGDPTNDFDNYWVKYSGEGKSGCWVECVKPGIDNTFNSATLPHRLVRTGTNQFTFAPCLWEKRTVGDENVSSTPTFIDNYINDIFLYHNRLCFLAGENVIMSKSSDFFNFWRSSASTVLDDDPIDAAVSANEGATLYHAEPFNDQLILFSEQQQFALSSGQNPLTLKTVAIDLSTKFVTSKTCKPISCGANIYFVSPKGDNTAIKEYFVQTNSLTNDAADVTAHVPRLIPKHVVKLAGSGSLDTVFALSSDTPTKLYTYKYYWSGDQKAQSSWSIWEYDGTIINCAILGTHLNLVVKRGSQVTLERCRLEKVVTGTLPFRVHLDRLTSLTGTYSADTGLTTWTLPYTDSSTADTWSVIKSSGGNSINGLTKPLTTTIQAVGNYSAEACYVGKTYDHRYRFSEWGIRNQGSNTNNLQGRLQMRTLTLNYTNTGYFKLEVTPQGRDKQTTKYNATIVGRTLLGTPSIVSETRRFPLMANAQGTKVELVNDSYLPSEFHAASLEGFYSTRNQGV